MIFFKSGSIEAVAAVSCVILLAASGCENKSGAADAREPRGAELPPSQGPAQQATPTNPPAAQPSAEPPNTQTTTTTSPATSASPTPSAPSPATPEQIAKLSQASGGPNGGMYSVVEGTKVDTNTLAGWKTWRALACDRCHGAEQQGLVGPPLVVSLHRLTKEQFQKTLTDGRPEKGMPPFSASAMVMANWENLYAYLKGRADGQIKPGHLYPLDAQTP